MKKQPIQHLVKITSDDRANQMCMEDKDLPNAILIDLIAETKKEALTLPYKIPAGVGFESSALNMATMKPKVGVIWLAEKKGNKYTLLRHLKQN
jgi:hypothetical protein